MITRHDVAAKLTDYLHHRLRLEDLVEWAEQAMMEEDFDPSHFATIRDILSRLGLANVREFSLSWEDCEEFLSRLGYQMRIEVSPVA
jgi:hypothetical protein